MADCRLMRFASKASAAESFLIPMWLKAESTRMEFTRFPGRCTTGGTTHGVYLLHGEFLGFHSVAVFPGRR